MATMRRDRGLARANGRGSILRPRRRQGRFASGSRPRPMNLRTALHLLVLSSGILAAVRGPVQAGQEERPLRYARISGESAAIFNLADEKGKEIARPSKGQ